MNYDLSLSKNLNIYFRDMSLFQDYDIDIVETMLYNICKFAVIHIDLDKKAKIHDTILTVSKYLNFANGQKIGGR